MTGIERQQSHGREVVGPKIHIVPPCSASDIRKALHISDKDREIALKVLDELFPNHSSSIIRIGVHKLGKES